MSSGNGAAGAAIDTGEEALKPLPLMRAGKLLKKPFPGERWLLHRIIPVRGFALLVAKAKAGKTQFLLWLALMVARGETFLSRATRKGSVIYLALEGDEQDMQERLAALGAKADDDLHLFIEPLVPELILERLTLNVASIKPVLIIIDTFVRFTGVADLNNYTEIYNLTARIQALVKEFNTSVVFSHHAGKADRDDAFDASIGSTSLRGVPDATLVIIKEVKTARRYLAIEQRAFRGEDMPPTELLMNVETGALSLGESKAQIVTDAIQQRIFDFLKTLKEGAPREAIQKAVGKNRQLVGETINTLLRMNFLHEVTASYRAKDGKRRARKNIRSTFWEPVSEPVYAVPAGTPSGTGQKRPSPRRSRASGSRKTKRRKAASHTVGRGK